MRHSEPLERAVLEALGLWGQPVRKLTLTLEVDCMPIVTAEFVPGSAGAGLGEGLEPELRKYELRRIDEPAEGVTDG